MTKSEYTFSDPQEEEMKDQQPPVSPRSLKSASSSFFHGEGFSLGWKDINYSVYPQKTWKQKILCQQPEGEKRQILNSVSGYVSSGEILAIMGPSGCGKSTLLDILANRLEVDNKNLTGEITVNGHAIDRKYKRIAAYVMQDDALHGSLTVRENFMYSALLRLPRTKSVEEKKQIVEDVLEILGLSHVADTHVGTPFIRGVSGGERRRVSIGLELLVQPYILFLDEPTSGLDSLSAHRVIESLKNLSRESNITVVASIHQPSTELFNVFDKLCLLSKGNTVYFGNVKGTPEYFANAGYPVPVMSNPADHFVSLINYDFDSVSENEAKKKEMAEDLIKHYKQSDEYKITLKRFEGSKDDRKEQNTENISSYATGFFYQVWILLRRTFLLYLKNPAIFWTRLAMYGILGLLMGTLYFDLEKAQDTIQDRISVLFFSVAFLAFMSVAAFPAFIEDRLIFVRERTNGWYHVAPYAIAHTLIQIPFVFLIAVTFTALSYPLIGLNSGSENVLYFIVMLFAALFVAESLVVMISAIIPFYIIGIAVGAMLYGVFMLVGGYFLRKTNIPNGWIWAHYLSFEKYSFEGMIVNEFEGKNFPCDGVCFFPDLNGDNVISGKELLEEYDYEDVDKWFWLGVTAIYAVVFRILFYVLLRFCNRGKR